MDRREMLSGTLRGAGVLLGTAANLGYDRIERVGRDVQRSVDVFIKRQDEISRRTGLEGDTQLENTILGEVPSRESSTRWTVKLAPMEGTRVYIPSFAAKDTFNTRNGLSISLPDQGDTFITLKDHRKKNGIVVPEISVSHYVTDNPQTYVDKYLLAKPLEPDVPTDVLRFSRITRGKVIDVQFVFDRDVNEWVGTRMLRSAA